MKTIPETKMGPDVVGLTNAVCEGQSFIFAENFMQRMPILLESIKNMYWKKKSVPKLPEKIKKAYLVVYENPEKVLTVREATYFNGYELHFEDIAAYDSDAFDIECRTDKFDDISYFYTGWGFDTSDAEGVFFELIKKGCVKAWRDHPAVPDLNELKD